jgi:hypothetical protein
VRHGSSEDLHVHSRNLESILHPTMGECVNGVLQVAVPRTVPAHQHPPSNVGYCHSTGHTRDKTSMHVDPFPPIKVLYATGGLHAPWPGNTLDLVLGGLGDAQLEQ